MPGSTRISYVGFLNNALYQLGPDDKKKFEHTPSASKFVAVPPPNFAPSNLDQSSFKMLVDSCMGMVAKTGDPELFQFCSDLLREFNMPASPFVMSSYEFVPDPSERPVILYLLNGDAVNDEDQVEMPTNVYGVGVAQGTGRNDSYEKIVTEDVVWRLFDNFGGYCVPWMEEKDTFRHLPSDGKDCAFIASGYDVYANFR